MVRTYWALTATSSIAVLLVLTVPAIHAGGDNENAGVMSYVCALTNDPSSNSIVAFRRAANGTLTLAKSVPTGGKGSGGNLASQGALIGNGKFLFGVNAGSNTITVFRASPLAVVSSVASGGTSPASLTYFGGYLYVLNAKGTANITGFSFNQSSEVLTPLPGSTQPLSAASVNPAQISFNQQGNALIVTEKGTSLIDVYTVTNGVAGPPTSFPSEGITPYGFATTRGNWFIVSEAQSGQGIGNGTVSSYVLSAGNIPSPITNSLPLEATAPCWLVINPSQTYAYVSNNGSDTISQLAISPAGALTLVKSYSTGSNTLPADLAMSSDGRNLYVVNITPGTIGAFTVNPDGSLSAIAGGSGVKVNTGLLAR